MASAAQITAYLDSVRQQKRRRPRPAQPPAGTVNEAYEWEAVATGGLAPYQFTLTGDLPDGLSFTSGVLSGTPTESGVFPVWLNISDDRGRSSSRQVDVVVQE